MSIISLLSSNLSIHSTIPPFSHLLLILHCLLYLWLTLFSCPLLHRSLAFTDFAICDSFSLPYSSLRSLSRFVTIYRGPSHTYKVQRLTESSSYSFRIQAISDAGEGPFSDTHRFCTTKSVPPALKGKLTQATHFIYSLVHQFWTLEVNATGSSTLEVTVNGPKELIHPEAKVQQYICFCLAATDDTFTVSLLDYCLQYVVNAVNWETVATVITVKNTLSGNITHHSTDISINREITAARVQTASVKLLTVHVHCLKGSLLISFHWGQ